MNPLAIAVQGLGFDAAMVALHGLLQFVVQEVQKHDAAAGGGIKTRRRVVGMSPVHTPDQTDDDDEDELLLLLGAV